MVTANGTKVTVEHMVPYDTPPYDRLETFNAVARDIREVERDVLAAGITDVYFEATITGVPWDDNEEWIIRQKVEVVFGESSGLQADGWYLDRMAD